MAFLLAVLLVLIATETVSVFEKSVIFKHKCRF